MCSGCKYELPYLLGLILIPILTLTLLRPACIQMRNRVEVVETDNYDYELGTSLMHALFVHAGSPPSRVVPHQSDFVVLVGIGVPLVRLGYAPKSSPALVRLRP